MNTKNVVKKVGEEMKNTGITLAIIGASKSGKTTFLSEFIPLLIEDANIVDTGGSVNILFSSNIHSPIYDSFRKLKNTVFDNKFNPELISIIYKINQELLKQKKKPYRFIVILDDIIDSKDARELQKLLTIYRNSNISTIISVQDSILIKKANRANLNFIIFCKMHTDESIRDVIIKFIGNRLSDDHGDKSMKSDSISKYRDRTSQYKKIILDQLNDEFGQL